MLEALESQGGASFGTGTSSRIIQGEFLKAGKEPPGMEIRDWRCPIITFHSGAIPHRTFQDMGFCFLLFSKI